MLTQEEFKKISERAAELKESFIKCEMCYAQEPPGEEINALMKEIEKYV